MYLAIRSGEMVELKPMLNKDGYYHISLSKDGKVKTFN